jgi:hypothetical protein
MILNIEEYNKLNPTYGIVYAGLSGFQRFVTRKKSRFNLIISRYVIPHYTISCNCFTTVNNYQRQWERTEDKKSTLCKIKRKTMPSSNTDALLIHILFCPTYQKQSYILNFSLLLKLKKTIFVQ